MPTNICQQLRDGIAALVQRHARRETWLYYGLVSIGLLLLLVAALAIAPGLFA